MRAKFINEKFIEDSDPIKDLSIGLSWETLRPGVILKILNSFPGIKKVKGDIIKITKIQNHHSGRKIINYVYLNKKYKNLSTVSWQFGKSWFEENFEILGIDTSVNEKFSENGDPIKDMGIGITPMAEAKKFVTTYYGDMSLVAKKYFGDEKYTALSYVVLYFFKFILDGEENVQDAFYNATIYENFYGMRENIVNARKIITDAIKKINKLEVNPNDPRFEY